MTEKQVVNQIMIRLGILQGLDKVYESTKTLYKMDLQAHEKGVSLWNAALKSGESSVVNLLFHHINYPEDGIGYEPVNYEDGDVVKSEFALRVGRADIVVFHTNGNATVIEVKDGSQGIRSVIGGIGQVGMYAVQLGMSPGSIGAVNRCLAWSEMGEQLDALTYKACETAGVIPVRVRSPESIRGSIERSASRSAAQACRSLVQELGFDSIGQAMDSWGIEQAIAFMSRLEAINGNKG